MKIIHTRAKVRGRLSEVSALSWSTSADGVFAPATSHYHPYVWNDVLENVGDTVFGEFIGRLRRAAAESPLAVDTLTAMDVAAAAMETRDHVRRVHRLIPELVEIPYAKFRFLVTVGHGSSHESQGYLVDDLVHHVPTDPRTYELLTDALWRVRATLGDHSRDRRVAPHYVADVVAITGLRNLLRLFGAYS